MQQKAFWKCCDTCVYNFFFPLTLFIFFNKKEKFKTLQCDCPLNHPCCVCGPRLRHQNGRSGRKAVRSETAHLLWWISGGWFFFTELQDGGARGRLTKEKGGGGRPGSCSSQGFAGMGFHQVSTLDVWDNWAKAIAEEEKGVNFCKREVRDASHCVHVCQTRPSHILSLETARFTGHLSPSERTVYRWMWKGQMQRTEIHFPWA